MDQVSERSKHISCSKASVMIKTVCNCDLRTVTSSVKRYNLVQINEMNMLRLTKLNAV